MYLCRLYVNKAHPFTYPISRMSTLRHSSQHKASRRETLLDLLKLGTPIILGQLGIITVNFADTIMVGRYSTDALASASFVNNIFSLFFVLGLGFTYGLTPLIARAYRRGDSLRQGMLLRHSTLLNLAIVSLLLLPLLGIYFFVDRFGLSPHLLHLVRPYFLLQLASLLTFMASGALKQFFDGMGKTQIPMWIILTSNVLNIIGNYLLIFGKAGFPELGLFGAGLSTLLSRIYMLIAMALVLAKSKELRPVFHVALRGPIRLPYLRQLFFLGLPIGVQTGVEAAAWSLAILFITPLGEVPLAVHQILCTLTGLGFLVYYGIGAASTILVSRAVGVQGEGQKQAVRQIVSVALALAEVVAIVVLAGIVLLRNQLGALFSDNPEIIAMTALAVLPMALYQPADAVQVVYSNALRGLEDVRRMALYACGVHLVLAPTLCYIFGYHLGLENAGWQLTAMWSAFPISLVVLGLLLYQRFQSVTSRLRS